MTDFRLAAALGAMLVFAACARAPGLHGTVLPPKPAPAFTLTGQDARPHALSEQRGNVVALYFGFTHCKDVCPQTLALLQRAARASGEDRRVRILFVSTDPANDTPAAMRTFLQRRHVRATGLTGSARRLAAVWRAYGVSVESTRVDVAHSSYAYLIAPDGTLREILHDDAGVGAIAADMRQLAS